MRLAAGCFGRGTRAGRESQQLAGAFQKGRLWVKWVRDVVFGGVGRGHGSCVRELVELVPRVDGEGAGVIARGEISMVEATRQTPRKSRATPITNPATGQFNLSGG